MTSLLFVLSIAASAFAMLLVCLSDVRMRDATFFPTYVVATLLLQFVVSPFVIYFAATGVNPNFPTVYLEQYRLLLAALICTSFFLGFWGGSVVGRRGAASGRFVQVRPGANTRAIAVSIFAVSVFCFGAFVYLYGGLDYVLSNASQIRSGVDDNKNYLGAFFKLFTYYIEFVLFFVYAKFLSSRNRNWLILSIVMVLLCLAKSAVDAGRGGLLNILIGVVFVSVFSGVRLPFVKTLIALLAGFFVVIYGKTFVFQVYSGALFSDVSSRSSIKADLVNALAEFSHPFLSVVLAIEQGILGSRWFIDIFVWILKPLKLIGVDAPDSISYYNTYLFSGVWDSEIPPGIVAFSYHQGGMLLVPVFGLIAGFLLSRINSGIKRTLKHSAGQRPFAVALCSVIAIYIPFIFANSDPALFVQWVFAYLLLFLVLRIFGVVRFPRVPRSVHPGGI